MQRRGLGLLLLGVALSTGGCMSPAVGVRTVRTDSLFEKLRVNVLNSGELSPRTTQVLRRYDLERKYNVDPKHALADLRSLALAQPDPDMVCALAEISYLTGKRTERWSKKGALGLYAATTAYAYFYLFDEEVGARCEQYDPQFRLVCDLYNSALTQCLRLARKDKKLGESLAIDLPQGPVNLTITRDGIPWNADDIDDLLFAGDYEVQGLQNNYRSFGLGVPMIGVRRRPRVTQGPEKFLLATEAFPVTALLRMTGKLREQGAYVREATLELHDPLRRQTVTIAHKTVPLESDLTTPLGYLLSQSRLDRLAWEGLLRADRVQALTGLYMTRPYEKGKIPVVMVHGLWSSPMTWMQMFNDLQADPEIRDKYQFWFFLYPTANPILYSSRSLRAALEDARQTLDPDRRDPSLGRMVLVGHSMGGLLSRLMTESSGDRFWNEVSHRNWDDIKGAPETRELIRQVFFFEPEPSVERVIFIATPHRGSPLSQRARIVTHLISLPKKMLSVQKQLLALNPDAFDPAFHNEIPNSVENLSPNSPVLKLTAEQPVNPKVAFHSIIGTIRDGDPSEWTDGVVPYASAHVEGVQSELIVHSGHNAHHHPLTVLEVRRILGEHLRQAARPEVVPVDYQQVTPTEIESSSDPKISTKD